MRARPWPRPADFRGLVGCTVEARKLEYFCPPTPKPKEHTSAQIHIPSFWSLLYQDGLLDLPISNQIGFLLVAVEDF